MIHSIGITFVNYISNLSDSWARNEFKFELFPMFFFGINSHDWRNNKCSSQLNKLFRWSTSKWISFMNIYLNFLSVLRIYNYLMAIDIFISKQNINMLLLSMECYSSASSFWVTYELNSVTIIKILIFSLFWINFVSFKHWERCSKAHKWS